MVGALAVSGKMIVVLVEVVVVFVTMVVTVSVIPVVGEGSAGLAKACSRKKKKKERFMKCKNTREKKKHVCGKEKETDQLFWNKREKIYVTKLQVRFQKRKLNYFNNAASQCFQPSTGLDCSLLFFLPLFSSP